jgi:predicted DCC family thiol-disulfide oxidoreductase YuxK
MTAPATFPVVHFTVRGMAEVEHAPTGHPYTVVYDGFCKVCGRLVTVLRKWDRGKLLEIVSSQTPGVQARFPWIPARAYLESVQVIGPGGRTWQGAAAIEQLLRILPKGRLMSWVFSIPFVRPLAERFYRWFARNRYKLGCGAHCQLKPEDLDFGEDG